MEIVDIAARVGITILSIGGVGLCWRIRRIIENAEAHALQVELLMNRLNVQGKEIAALRKASQDTDKLFGQAIADLRKDKMDKYARLPAEFETLKPRNWRETQQLIK